MLKIVHIHTDEKFLNHSELFNCDQFNNKTFLFSNKSKPTQKSICLLKETSKNFKLLINECNNSDLVIFYDLDKYKVMLSEMISDSVCVIWRLFGHEFYSKYMNAFISNSTRESLKNKSHYFLQKILKKAYIFNFANMFFVIKNGLLFKAINTDRFNKALKRFDGILLTSIEEYDLIHKYWSFIKNPIVLPISQLFITSSHLKRKKKKIIIGNSRNIWNNHMDVIDLIKSSDKNYLYQFFLFFSYGDQNNYSKTIKAQINHCDNIHIINDFVTKKEFTSFYSDVSALVINSYRQLALGNIFTALNAGVKIYLNRRNSTMTWLKNEGFIIFDVGDLVSDINNNNLELTNNQKLYNYNQLIFLAKKYPLSQFHNRLLSLIKSKNDKKNH